MGAGVSHWFLAKTVSKLGQLGVVSGTALDMILVRRLQDGDEGGHVRRALAAFPDQEIANGILDRYFIEGGRPKGKPYRNGPMLNATPGRLAQELAMAANFVEVYLAKEGHSGKVGINFLEKIQMATLSAVYGAMLAKVDCVLMGAGIPMEIPGVLDRFARHEKAELRLNVDGVTNGDDFRMSFDPREALENVISSLPPLTRPVFLAIISSVILATALIKKASGTVDGFVVEHNTAGGHNAPPRGPALFTERGEPVYGAKDEVELSKIAQMGRPFWLAGGYASPARLQEALAAGATGVQVGTVFALSSDSGLADELRSTIIADVANGGGEVVTDALASPTGFPFKVITVPGTNSELDVYKSRTRICDLGYLRTPYKKADGALGYRCASEPVADYVAKGGLEKDTEGRKCLCNALLANVGLSQVQKDGRVEKALVTSGDDVRAVETLIARYGPAYTARNVVDYLLGADTPDIPASD